MTKGKEEYNYVLKGQMVWMDMNTGMEEGKSPQFSQ